MIYLRKSIVDYVIEATEMPAFQAFNALIKRFKCLLTVKVAGVMRKFEYFLTVIFLNF